MWKWHGVLLVTWSLVYQAALMGHSCFFRCIYCLNTAGQYTSSAREVHRYLIYICIVTEYKLNIRLKCWLSALIRGSNTQSTAKIMKNTQPPQYLWLNRLMDDERVGRWETTVLPQVERTVCLYVCARRGMCFKNEACFEGDLFNWFKGWTERKRTRCEFEFHQGMKVSHFIEQWSDCSNVTQSSNNTQELNNSYHQQRSALKSNISS